jgi:hypothetical protein
VAVYGVGCLIACAIIGLSHVVQPWLGALIVGFGSPWPGHAARPCLLRPMLLGAAAARAVVLSGE